MGLSLLLMSTNPEPSVPFEIVLQNLNRIDILEKKYYLYELSVSSFKDMKKIIEQINFLSKLPGCPNAY